MLSFIKMTSKFNSHSMKKLLLSNKSLLANVTQEEFLKEMAAKGTNSMMKRADVIQIISKAQQVGYACAGIGALIDCFYAILNGEPEKMINIVIEKIVFCLFISLAPYIMMTLYECLKTIKF